MYIALQAIKWNICDFNDGTGLSFIVSEPYSTGRRKKPRIVQVAEEDLLQYIEAEVLALESNEKYYDANKAYENKKFGGYGGFQYAMSQEYKHYYDRYYQPLKQLMEHMQAGGRIYKPEPIDIYSNQR